MESCTFPFGTNLQVSVVRGYRGCATVVTLRDLSGGAEPVTLRVEAGKALTLRVRDGRIELEPITFP